MKNVIWKRLFVAVCIVALLLNSSVITAVMADEVRVEEVDGSEIEDDISIDVGIESNTNRQTEIFQEENKQEFSEPGKITGSIVPDDNSIVASDVSMSEVPNDIQEDTIEEELTDEKVSSIESEQSIEENINEIEAEMLVGSYDYTWFNQKLEELKNEFPTGTRWDNSNRTYPAGWYGCRAFTNMLADRIFGYSTPENTWIKIKINDVKPGDIILENGSLGLHTMFVTYTNGDKVSVCEGNHLINKVGCVYWGKSFNKYSINVEAVFHAPNYDSIIIQPTPTPIIGKEMDHGYEAVLPDGDYQIVSAADPSYYLDIEGRDLPASGRTNVSLCGPDIGHLPSYEIWNIKYSNGFYTIRQKGTDMCLDVVDASQIPNANIHMWQSCGNSAQKWAISKFDDQRGYRLQAKCSGFSLDITDVKISSGTNVEQYPGNNSDAQRWLFIPYEPKRTISDGRYILVSALNPHLVLDIQGDTGNVPNDTNVQVWNDSAASRYNSIDVEYLDHGYYRLTHAASGKSLDVFESNPTARTNIQLYASGEQNCQKWAIIKSGSGYVIFSRCSGLVMDVDGGVIADGTNVQEYYYNGSSAQTWTFVQAEYSVNYNANSGAGAPASQTKYYRNALTLSSTKPTRSGYTFKGWSTSNTATSADYLPGSSYTADKDITLYAVWEKQKTALSDCSITLSQTSYTYDGSVKIPSVTVKNGSTVLSSGTDYSVAYSNNTNAGAATVTITGKGSYTGTIKKTFTINQATPKLTFANSNVSKTTLDAAFTNTLTKTTDGTVSFKSSNTNVATVNSSSGQVTIKGIGSATITASATAGTNYKAGSASYTLTVTDGRTDLSKCTVTLSSTSYTYNGSAKKPTVTVKNGSSDLTSGTDYTVAYTNNTNAGTATVTVTGTGNCIGTNSTTFKINKAVPKLTFASESVSKEISDDAFINELTKTTDGTVTLSSSDTNVATVNSTTGIVTIRGTGTATITASASAGNNYKAGSASYILDVSGISIENAAVGGVSLSYGYSGKAYTPAVTVKMDGVMLTKDTDYTVRYENNQNPGTATITVTGKGKYSGTKTKTFEIVDCVSSVVSGKTYLLIPKNNSKTAVCAYAGKMVNNTKIYITDRGNSESQKFKAVKNSDGTWKFINAKCELALAVQQNSSALGAGLVLYDQTTRPAQNWKLSKKSDNSFAIINSVTGYSIAMSDKSAVKGTTLSMAETASVGLQRFYIVETSAVSAPFDGTNSIRAAKDQSFAVNIASSSKEDGANVSLYTYTNSNARKFKIIYSGGGYYRLGNVNSGLCLTIKDNSDADGANIIQSKWKGYSSQRWKITKNSDGTVTITNMLGTVLHLLGNRTVNNTNIHARKAASTTAQKWYLQ